jgi:hypothetical protein
MRVLDVLCPSLHFAALVTYLCKLYCSHRCADLLANWRLREGFGTQLLDSGPAMAHGAFNSSQDSSPSWVSATLSSPPALRLVDGLPQFRSVVALLPTFRLLENFTLHALVLPESAHRVPAVGSSFLLDESNPGGKFLFGPARLQESPTGITVAVSVGTNGVVVYSFDPVTAQLAPLLVWSGCLTAWSALGVSVENNIPQLFVNGVLVAVGTAAASTLHYQPSTFGSSSGSLEGLLGPVQVYSRALSLSEHRSLSPYAPLGTFAFFSFFFVICDL